MQIPIANLTGKLKLGDGYCGTKENNTLCALSAIKGVCFGLIKFWPAKSLLVMWLASILAVSGGFVSGLAHAEQSVTSTSQNYQVSAMVQLKAAITANDLPRVRQLFAQVLPAAIWQRGNTLEYRPILTEITVPIRQQHYYPALNALYQYIAQQHKNLANVFLLKASYELVPDFMYFSKFDRLFEIYLPIYSSMHEWQPKDLHDQETLASVWFMYSQMLLRRNQSQQALAALFQAESIYQNIQIDHAELYRIYIVIGEVYLHLKQFAKAEHYINKGLHDFPATRLDARGYVTALLADSYTEQGKHQLALQIIAEYLKHPVDQRADYRLYVQDIYAKVLQNLEQGPQSLRVAEQALQLALTYGNGDLINQARFRLGKSHAVVGNLSQAEQLINQAIEQTSSDSKLNKANMYLELVQLLSADQRFEAALSEYKQYKLAFDQQVSLDNDFRIKDLELIRAQQKAEREREKFLSEQEKQTLQMNLVEQEKQNFRIVSIGLFVLVLLLMVVITSLFILFKTIKQANQQLSILSLEDPLTKLKNRRYIQSFIEVEATRLIRARGKALVLIADIDKFKAINDEYGHHVGDQVLSELADFFKKNLRQEDVIARWGGEEFLIICRSQGEQNDQMICQHLKSELAKVSFSQQKLSITLSIGGCYFPRQHVANLTNDSAAELMQSWPEQWQQTLSLADDALYRVKRHGRNNYAIESLLATSAD